MSRIFDPRRPRSASRFTRQLDRDRSSRSRRTAIRRRVLAERLETRRLLASDVFINDFHYDNVGTDTEGTIDSATPLGITDAAGYLTLDLDAEKGTVTFLLVKDFTGTVGDDLDDDDDGLLDTTPWSAIVDAVATAQTAVIPLARK